MTRGVPAATHTLRALRFLAAQPGPVTADALSRAVGIPRSTAYALLRAMTAEGFVVHHPDTHRWALGVAVFETGSGYARHQPLRRLARLPMAGLVDATGCNAHLAVLHGNEVLYVHEERAPGRPPPVTDVGVRLPAALTASGRAVLSRLTAAQVRALFPDRDAFVRRHGVGPTGPADLRALLADTRRRGHALEEGEVTPGFSSVAVAVPVGTPVYASVALTYPSGETGPEAVSTLVEAVRRTAHEVARRAGVVPAERSDPVVRTGSRVPATGSPQSD